MGIPSVSGINGLRNDSVLNEMTMDDGRPAHQLAELVEQHYSVLFRYAFRLTGRTADAEDLVQQSFLIAHRKIEQLRDPANGKAWLFTIARNSYLRSLRGKEAARIVSLDQAPEPGEDCPADAKLDGEQLQSILHELEEEFRTPLILFYFEQFSYKEIAEQMDVPIGTIMSRLARAKAHLRRRLASFQPIGK